MNEIRELVEKYDNIVIYRHKRPDLDALGSQFGLREILKNNYPSKNVYAIGIDGVEDFEFTEQVDFYMPKKDDSFLAIIVDTGNEERIEDDSYKFAEKKIKIDHHQIVETENYGDINYVLEDSSSTGEIVVDLAIKLNWLTPPNACICLFNALYGDTGGFTFPNTTSKTFEMLAYLRSKDWDYETQISKLKTYDITIMKLVGYSLQNIYVEDGVGFLKFDREFQKENNVHPSQISQVVNFLGMIKQLEKWVVFNEYKGFIRINIRSRRAYDISTVAVEYEGGGHKNASGGKIYDWEQTDEVINKIKNVEANVN